MKYIKTYEKIIHTDDIDSGDYLIIKRKDEDKKLPLNQVYIFSSIRKNKKIVYKKSPIYNCVFIRNITSSDIEDFVSAECLKLDNSIDKLSFYFGDFERKATTDEIQKFEEMKELITTTNKFNL